jgi:hypothetical protein
MVAHPVLLVVVLVLATPLLWLFWRQLFGTRKDLLEDLERHHRVDWSPLKVALRGEHQEHAWSSMRLLLFLLLGVGFVAALYRAGTLIFF